MAESISEQIPGADAITAWFGYWPDFHDAEILELHLNRFGSSWIKIYAWNTTKRTDDKGYFITEKHAVVTFFFDKVSDLQFADFSSQNVIGGLTISRCDNELRLSMSPCYGLSGFLQGIISKVELSPGKIDN